MLEEKEEIRADSFAEKPAIEIQRWDSLAQVS